MKLTLLLLSGMLLVNSCGKNEGSNKLPELIETQKSEDEEITTNLTDYLTDSTDNPRKQEPGNRDQIPRNRTVSNPDWDKKIIKTASVNVEVKDYNSYNSSLREKVRQVGGYVAQEEQVQSEYKIENNLVIKVPVDQFDNAIDLLTTAVEKINEKKIISQDVTNEFVDTKLRLEAKKQIRLRYIDFLRQAKNIQEILQVQSEINGIQEGIESAEGRIEYLGHSSSFSTINLSYYQVLNAFAGDPGKPSFGSKLSNAFKTGSKWVLDFFIGIVTIWPLWLMIFIALIIYKKSRIPKAKQA